MKLSLATTIALGAAIFAAPAHANEAIEAAAVTLQPNAYVWKEVPAPVAQGPVTVVVSIADQRAYVYRGSALVAASAVSTGKEGKDTPIGTYRILQKKIDHKSNLYDDAAMPYMQRLTWDGIAIHAGKNPGFPNSHGCIRVPAAFAKKLFAATKLGTTVTVTDESALYAAPVDLVPDGIAEAAAEEADAIYVDAYSR